MQCIPHVFPFIERYSCHWLLNVTLQLAPATAVLEFNRSIFLQLHLLKFHVVLALHTGLVCPAICAKLNMMFKWIVDKTGVILLVLLTYFRFCNGRNLQMLLVVNTVLGSCEYRNFVWCTFYSSVYSTTILPIFVCTVGHFQSEFSFATVTVF